MFKVSFFTGFTSAVLSTAACLIYSGFYFKEIADFSEAGSGFGLTMNCLLVAMSATFIHFGLSYLIRKGNWANVIFNLLFSLFSLAMVFVVLKGDDPTFKNEDAQAMNVFYKGFVMPMLFFPALGWFISYPIFSKR